MRSVRYWSRCSRNNVSGRWIRSLLTLMSPETSVDLERTAFRVLFDVKAPESTILQLAKCLSDCGYDPTNIGSVIPHNSDEMSRVDVQMRSRKC